VSWEIDYALTGLEINLQNISFTGLHPVLLIAAFQAENIRARA
jgi:hypothetical protein